MQQLRASLLLALAMTAEVRQSMANLTEFGFPTSSSIVPHINLAIHIGTMWRRAIKTQALLELVRFERKSKASQSASASYESVLIKNARLQHLEYLRIPQNMLIRDI